MRRRSKPPFPRQKSIRPKPPKSRGQSGQSAEALIARKKFESPRLIRFLRHLPQWTRSGPGMKAAAKELIQAYQEINGPSDAEKIWYRLERAHILCQRSAAGHFLIHVIMLVFAAHRREFREVLGQFPRILLSIPSSLFNFAPRGNSGRTKMGVFAKGEIPEDLKRLVTDGGESESGR